MVALIIAVALTLGISAVCSLLEAFILSTTTAEVESLKKSRPGMGKMLSKFADGIDETSSAILTLNTIANTAGATVVGSLSEAALGVSVLTVSLLMTGGILVLSEIIPKNLGVAYRKQLQVYVVYPIWIIRISMTPFSFAFKRMLTMMVRSEQPTEHEQEEEIRLLAEKSFRSGALSDSERELISNALSLDDLRVSEIMTPRTVVTFLDGAETVEEVCEHFKIIPFARMPVYRDGLDDILGIVRRRDILQAYSEDRGEVLIGSLMGDVIYVPETASVLNALQLLLKKHQQFAVVVDEYGSTAGVLSMEDIVEHLIGSEIYEPSDIAVDMRELAKKRAERRPDITPVAPPVVDVEDTPAETPASPRPEEKSTENE